MLLPVRVAPVLVLGACWGVSSGGAPKPAAAQAVHELLFPIAVGDETWIRLADLDPTSGPHPAPGGRLVTPEWGETTLVGVVAEAEVPAAHRRRELRTDTGCVARVTGFAVLTRLIGDPTYAGEDAPEWTEDLVRKHGARTLAARVEGCPHPRWVHDAALPPVVEFEVVESDGPTIEAARVRLLASEAAIASGGSDEDFGPWTDEAEWDVVVRRHPTTGVRLVTAHAVADRGCGPGPVSLLGVYRLGADGQLEAVVERDLDILLWVDAWIDLEGDGGLELLGRLWPEDHRVLVQAASGGTIDRVTTPFYQCGC